MTALTTTRGHQCGTTALIVVGLVFILSGSVAAWDASGEAEVGPDVVVYEVPSTYNWGASGGVRAYSVGTTSCNRGDQDLNWVSSTNQHPVIAQNLYRVTLLDAGSPVEHGKIEMLGISWLKHGFVSVNGTACETATSTCQNPGTGSLLGVGCSDPYSAHLNGSQSRLGARSEVDAFTGDYLYPRVLSPSGNTTLAGRLQVKESELINDPTRYSYFVEGQYVAPDDAAAGNGLNNASFREVLFSGSELTTIGPTEEGRAAIYAWRDLDPAVEIREVVVPGEGLFIVGYKVADNQDGTWHYEYAVFNLNSHLSGRSFSVPILADSVITNPGFRDVDYHSGEPYGGTDWMLDVNPEAGWVSWSTADHATDPNANALRWSTMYNFSFDADSPPVAAGGVIGLYRAGGPRSVTVSIEAPASGAVPLFADGFESGDTRAWSIVTP